MTSVMNKSPLAKRYPGACVVRWNDYEINVWLECVLAPSVTEMIKVIKKGKKNSRWREGEEFLLIFKEEMIVAWLSGSSQGVLR